MRFHSADASTQGSRAYPDCGCDAVVAIANALGLDDLQNYTPEERDAISRELSNFQRLANEIAGDDVRFHPEVVEPIRRKYAARALEELADEGWRFTPKHILPQNWRARVATYLKAWICDMNPEVLTRMAEMLAKAGRKSEAATALQVVLLFRDYAASYYGDVERSHQLAEIIVADAQEQLQNLRR